MSNNIQGKYASVNGIQMYYELHGSGSPLVLLHGGGSTIQTTFGKVLPLLAKTHMVIAVELQAHGHTGDRDAPESFDQDAADVHELLRQLDIEQVNVLGFSNGGQTAMVMGMKYPARVRKLIVASAFYKREGTPEGFWTGFDEATLDQLPQVYKDEYLAITGNQEGLQNMFNKDANRMRVFEGWTDDDIRSIQAHTLILAGDRDLPTPEHLVEMYRLLPNGRLAILPGDHGSYMGEAMTPDAGNKMPEAFVTIVEMFLNA
jgi:pimeloyl-ACP methyl ester carboxylesterase